MGLSEGEVFISKLNDQGMPIKVFRWANYVLKECAEGTACGRAQVLTEGSRDNQRFLTPKKLNFTLSKVRSHEQIITNIEICKSSGNSRNLKLTKNNIPSGGTEGKKSDLSSSRGGIQKPT